MMAFLPPISAMTCFTCVWPSDFGREPEDPRADLLGAGEGDEADRRVRDEPVADPRPRTRQELHDPGRHADLLQERHEARGDHWRSEDGFRITALPATMAAESMPVRIASGKFQGGITTPIPRGRYS